MSSSASSLRPVRPIPSSLLLDACVRRTHCVQYRPVYQVLNWTQTGRTLSDRCPAKFVQNLSKICPKFVQNLSKISRNEKLLFLAGGADDGKLNSYGALPLDGWALSPASLLHNVQQFSEQGTNGVINHYFRSNAGQFVIPF